MTSEIKVNTIKDLGGNTIVSSNGSGTFTSNLPSSIGGATGVDFNDNVKARFGTGNDLEIYHDGNSIIRDGGSGSLVLRTNNLVVQNAAGNANIINAPEGASGTDFSYNGSVKLSVENTGINITGKGKFEDGASSGVTASTSANTVVADSNSASGNGISILSKNDANGSIFFGDAEDNDICKIKYDHSTNLLKFDTASATAFTMDQNGIINKPLQPSFLALNHGSDSITNATETVIALDSEIFDTNGDVSSNTFTAPVTGKYYLSSMVCLDAGSSSNSRFNRVYIEIVCSNRNARFEYGQNYTDEDDRMGVTGSFLVDMDANDTAQVKVSASRNGASGATTTVGNASNALTFFCGYLVA